MFILLEIHMSLILLIYDKLILILEHFDFQTIFYDILLFYMSKM